MIIPRFNFQEREFSAHKRKQNRRIAAAQHNAEMQANRAAKKAKKSKDDKDYKKLGKLMFKILDVQDNQSSEYITLTENSDNNAD